MKDDEGGFNVLQLHVIVARLDIYLQTLKSNDSELTCAVARRRYESQFLWRRDMAGHSQARDKGHSCAGIAMMEYRGVEAWNLQYDLDVICRYPSRVQEREKNINPAWNILRFLRSFQVGSHDLQGDQRYSSPPGLQIRSLHVNGLEN